MLDQISLGVIVCDIQTQVLFANRIAKVIAANQDGIIIHNNELTANEQTVSFEFRNLIRQGIEAIINGNPQQCYSMSLPRRQSNRPLHVRITPLLRHNAPFADQNLTEPLCAVYISDPDRPQETEAELLQRMFGLTPTEAEVLNNLVLGLTVNQTATARGITTATVRTHLKTLFNKTGTTSQSELIKMVVTSPTWVGLSAIKH